MDIAVLARRWLSIIKIIQILWLTVTFCVCVFLCVQLNLKLISIVCVCRSSCPYIWFHFAWNRAGCPNNTKYIGFHWFDGIVLIQFMALVTLRITHQQIVDYSTSNAERIRCSSSLSLSRFLSRRLWTGCHFGSVWFGKMMADEVNNDCWMALMKIATRWHLYVFEPYESNSIVGYIGFVTPPKPF